MNPTQTKFAWEQKSKEKFDFMIRKIPLFHREIAQQVVEKKALLNAQERGSSQVEESDIVRAFFSEVPMTFYSLMIRVMDEVGFDYHEFDLKGAKPVSPAVKTRA